MEPQVESRLTIPSLWRASPTRWRRELKRSLLRGKVVIFPRPVVRTSRRLGAGTERGDPIPSWVVEEGIKVAERAVRLRWGHAKEIVDGVE
jgi:hypothetical protein